MNFQSILYFNQSAPVDMSSTPPNFRLHYTKNDVHVLYSMREIYIHFEFVFFPLLFMSIIDHNEPGHAMFTFDHLLVELGCTQCTPKGAITMGVLK